MEDQEEHGGYEFYCHPDIEQDGTEFSYGDIVRNASMYKRVEESGIYFLISLDTIVYVGQTINLKNRLEQHWRSDKGWNRYFFVRCKKEDLNRMEAYYILKFRPKYNIAIPRGES